MINFKLLYLIVMGQLLIGIPILSFICYKTIMYFEEDYNRIIPVFLILAIIGCVLSLVLGYFGAFSG